MIIQKDSIVDLMLYSRNTSTLINPIFIVTISNTLRIRFIDFDFFESGRAAGKNTAFYLSRHVEPITSDYITGMVEENTQKMEDCIINAIRSDDEAVIQLTTTSSSASIYQGSRSCLGN